MSKVLEDKKGSRYHVIAGNDEQLDQRLKLLAAAIEAVRGRVVAVVRRPANTGRASAEVHYVLDPRSLAKRLERT